MDLLWRWLDASGLFSKFSLSLSLSFSEFKLESNSQILFISFLFPHTKKKRFIKKVNSGEKVSHALVSKED